MGKAFFQTTLCLLTSLMMLNPGLTAAATESNLLAAKHQQLERELGAIANDSQHPLASVAVVAIKGGQVVYQQQFGRRIIDDLQPANNLPANGDTLYRIASISKMVTALGVMRLVEDGKLNLDADVSDYLGYVLRNPHFPQQAISLRMLMSHTSSLRDDAGYNFPATVALRDVLVPGGSLYGKGAMWAADHGPGHFQYVNFNWGVIGTIMERASGERFDRLMQRLIFTPMALAAGFNAAQLTPAQLANFAILYRKRVEVDGKEIWHSDGPWIPQADDYRLAPPPERAPPGYQIGTNGTLFGPQGSLRISASGLARLMQMLLNDGQFAGQQILRPASIATMFAEQWRLNATQSNGDTFGNSMYAWGLGNQHFQNISGAGIGDRLVADGGFVGKGHMGDAYGLTSAFVLDFKTKNGLIYLIGGPAVDPSTYKGHFSSMIRYEELLLDALYRGALQ